MVGMIVAVCILSALFLTMAATVFCELPRNARDVFCFFGHARCGRGYCVGFHSKGGLGWLIMI